MRLTATEWNCGSLSRFSSQIPSLAAAQGRGPGKGHNPLGEGAYCLKKCTQGSWGRSRMCSCSCLKAELAGGEVLTLAVFGVQASLEFAIGGLQQENPRLAQRAWGDTGKPIGRAVTLAACSCSLC